VSALAPFLRATFTASSHPASSVTREVLNLEDALTLYSVALFLHIAGALGVFAALALDWVGIANLRRARTAEQVREWAGVYRIIRGLGAASVAALLVFGLYMTAVTWGPTGWIGIGFLSLLFIAVLGALSGVRLGRILAVAASGEGTLAEDLRGQLRAPLFVASVRARTAVALGVVFLMTTKPEAAVSLLVVGVALALGIASAVPVLRQRSLRPQST
jgi:hypothetical protein